MDYLSTEPLWGNIFSSGPEVYNNYKTRTLTLGTIIVKIDK